MKFKKSLAILMTMLLILGCISMNTYSGTIDLAGAGISGDEEVTGVISDDQIKFSGTTLTDDQIKFSEIIIDTPAPVTGVAIENGTNTLITNASEPVIAWYAERYECNGENGNFLENTKYQTKYVYTASSDYLFDSTITDSNIMVTNLGSGAKTVELSDDKKKLTIMVTWPRTEKLIPEGPYGSFDIITSDIKPTYDNGILTFANPGTYELKMQDGRSQTTCDKIVVNSEGTVNITLNGLDIDVSDVSQAYISCAFAILGSSNVNLTLKEGTTNTLKSACAYAALHVDADAAVTIDGNGTLNAIGGFDGAGIGSSLHRNQELHPVAGKITINEGNIFAHGGQHAAGIGGGFAGDGGNITINGGNVEAFGKLGAGIGGGNFSGKGGNISINGGNVKAIGYYGSGIGGGVSESIAEYGLSRGGDITVNGGNVIAISFGYTGAGIGAGKNVEMGTIKIDGDASVIAISDVSNYAIRSLGEIESNILMANYEGQIASNTKISVKNEKRDKTIVSYSPIKSYRSIAFTVPNKEKYTLYKDGTYQANGDSTNYIFDVTSSGLNIFNNVQECTLDFYPPTVESVIPRNGDTDIEINGNIAISFNKEMVSTGGKVQLNSLETLTGGSWSNGSKTYTIAYTGLENSTDYNIRIRDFKDLAGNELLENTSHTFTTIPKYIPGTYSVKGNVQENSGLLVAGASVKLMKGNRQIGSTGVTTDFNGEFTIRGVENGTYNLVVEAGGIIVTQKIVIDGKDYNFSGPIKLPEGKKNSVVEVKEDTPGLVVGGLENEFQAPKTLEKDKGITNEDELVVENGGSVEIKLIADKKDDTASNANNISVVAKSSGKTVGMFIDLSLIKTVKDDRGVEIAGQSTKLVELQELIDIIIPLDASMVGNSDYTVYRYHDSGVDEITTTPNADGEKIHLMDDGKSLKLTTRKFSTYAIAYTKPRSSSGGHSSRREAPKTIDIEQSAGGSISMSDDEKTARINPDDGYVIASLIVDAERVGPAETIAFDDSKKHSIAAKFVERSAIPYYLENDKKVYIGFSGIVDNIYKCIAPDGVEVEYMDNKKNFTDNNIAWAKSSIDFVAEREVFCGIAPDKFGPNEGMTRAMFVTVLGRLYEHSYGPVSGINSFSDVSENDYCMKYVAWADESGIISGVGEKSFAPNQMVTREQMAAIILNFASILEKADVSERPLRYSDSDKISSWAIDGAKYCQESKIISGRDGGNFAPKESATRAEVAAVIERFIEMMVK